MSPQHPDIAEGDEDKVRMFISGPSLSSREGWIGVKWQGEDGKPYGAVMWLPARVWSEIAAKIAKLH